jgi:hypothetical protein
MKGRGVFFFNFALKDGHFMSRPIFNPQQFLVGEIIHSLERFNPRFAWIQFLFSQRDYNHLLMYTKSELENYVQFASTTQYDERSRQKIPRKEINSQWYKLATPRIKKIEQMLPKPTVIFAINGMWVANDENNATSSLNQLSELPLSLCSDEIDRLRPFLYRDPMILRMLVERRMITDISPSIYKYCHSREEPPSLILSPEEIPYYIHMPTGVSAKGLSTIRPAAHFPVGATLKTTELMPVESYDNYDSSSKTEDTPIAPELEQQLFRIQENMKAQQLVELPQEKDNQNISNKMDSRKRGTLVAALRKIPTLEQALEEDEVQRLGQIVSRNIRTFEILYDSGGMLDENSNTSGATTKVLLSSSSETAIDDLEGVYIPQLESVYGKLDYELNSDKRPEFVVKDFPRILEL